MLKFCVYLHATNSASANVREHPVTKVNTAADGVVISAGFNLVMSMSMASPSLILLGTETLYCFTYSSSLVAAVVGAALADEVDFSLVFFTLSLPPLDVGDAFAPFFGETWNMEVDVN